MAVVIPLIAEQQLKQLQAIAAVRELCVQMIADAQAKIVRLDRERDELLQRREVPDAG